MSLINDALKRAKQAQQKSPPSPAPGPVLRPVEPVRRRDSSLGILVPLALVTLVVVGGLIIWFAMGSGGPKKNPSSGTSVKPVPVAVTTATKPVAPKPTATTSAPKGATAPTAHPPAPSSVIQLPPKLTTPLPNPVVTISEPKPTPNPVSVTSGTPASASPASVAATTRAVVVVSEPPPPPPLPKLQGIFYRPERPAALLNGKTVLVGGASGEYRVVAISQQSVTVVRAGQTNVLNMPD